MALLCLLLLLLRSSPSSTAADPIFNFCEGDTYADNSTFASNLNLLLASLSFSSSKSTFSNLTKGSIPDRAYGLFLCRGDISPSECSACVHTATQDAPQICRSEQLTLWYDTCQLRYSDEPFFSSFRDDKNFFYPTGLNASDPEIFRKNERALISNLSYQTAYNSNSLMFATGEILYGSSDQQQAIYGLVQCSRDLSSDMCSQCLQQLPVFFQNRDSQKEGGILGQSCSFRYGVSKFFEGNPKISVAGLSPSPSSPLPPSPLQPPSYAPTGEDDGKRNRNIIIISIVIFVVVTFILTFAVCIFMRRRSAKNNPGNLGMANPEEIPGPESLYFELSILKVATDNFSDFNKIGQGGFGAVYKGRLQNGQDIAVKRLSARSSQGIEELKNELLLVAKLQHMNLVRLRGVCLEGGEKLLVYEYMPNGSLDKFLFDPIKRKELNWERRFKIVEGIARGLLYLHEESHLKVIHRDLKASNVLLDADMKPKISDFGLARLFGGDETNAITSRVVGTFGYMAPEYARRGRFSTKLDVYSYGILVLEVVTGRRNSNFKYNSESGQDVLSYTWRHWKNGTTLEVVDPTLGEDYSRNEVFRCIQIGLLCAQQLPFDRPSMSLVFLMLNSPAMPLQDPLLPSYLAGLSIEESDVSLKVSSQQSYFGSADRSSTSGIGSSQQSGPRIISNTLDTNQKGEERVESKLISSQTFDSRRTQALSSQLSQTTCAGHPNTA